MMAMVTISKKEYHSLLDKKLRYDYLRTVFAEDIFSSPPTKDSAEVLAAFRENGRYSKKFLESLAYGLRRSSYFKK